MTYTPALDNSDLLSWDGIRAAEDVRWRGLLLGNGSSIAVAESFAYPSLYDVACSDRIDNPLGAASRRLFEDLATRNFEFVLASLKLAGRVNAAAGIDAPILSQLYREIQIALFESVASVHVEWDRVASRTLAQIRRELLNYKRVYSTNYDLLVYWAMLREGDPYDFRDFLWAEGNSFDPADVGILGDPTLVYFLHGGVHLRRTPNGRSFKRTAQQQQNLLSQFPTTWESDEIPLLISEGDSNDKLVSINRSDYLSFAYRRFLEHQGNLVVYGHGLGGADDHLVRAINGWSKPEAPRQIALSIRREIGEVAIRQEKQRLAQRLPESDLWFYDADSHPLGESNVRPRPVRDLFRRLR
ncbi:MAG: DUF4917 family protein [Gaiellaceae bacterium]